VAGADVGYRVTGLSSVLRALRGLSDDLSDLSGPLGALSLMLAASARAEAPVATGALRAGIVPERSPGLAGAAAVVRYAGPVNKLNPFMQRADDAIEPRVAPLLDDGISAAIRRRGL
jgi:hypothetical protein